jgi:hypothetical protein
MNQIRIPKKFKNKDQIFILTKIADVKNIFLFDIENIHLILNQLKNNEDEILNLLYFIYKLLESKEFTPNLEKKENSKPRSGYEFLVKSSSKRYGIYHAHLEYGVILWYFKSLKNTIFIHFEYMAHPKDDYRSIIQNIYNRNDGGYNFSENEYFYKLKKLIKEKLIIKFSDFLNEALTIKQYRPYHKEAEKANYKERYKDIFQKYEGDKNAFRIYLPLIKQNKKSETQSQIEDILKSLNYDISKSDNYDYAWGKIKFPGSKNWTGIGKILSKNPEYSKLLKAFAEDENRTLKGKDQDLEVCISRHPYDVVGSDTDRPWINCMTLYHYNRFKKEWRAKGQSIEHLKHDVRKGSLTAYLIKKSDRNLQEPLANIGIKPYENENDLKDIVLVPDNRMYGMRHPDFAATVFNWCDEVNGDKIGFYKIAKGLHMDNFKRKKGMEETGHLINDIEEFDYQDDRSYYARKHLPSQGFKGKFESFNNDEFEVGDYILVDSKYNELFHEIMKIVFINKDLSIFEVKLLDPNYDYSFTIYKNDIIRKLEEHEIDALKYNL